MQLPAVNVVNQINTATRDHRVKLYRLVLSSDTPQALAENRTTLDGVSKAIDKLRRDYEALPNSDAERAHYEKFSTLGRAISPSSKRSSIRSQRARRTRR